MYRVIKRETFDFKQFKILKMKISNNYTNLLFTTIIAFTFYSCNLSKTFHKPSKIDLDIKKVKKSDSLSINIIQTPATKQSPVNQITPQEPVQNACPENSICIPIKNLTRRQKKRLDLL